MYSVLRILRILKFEDGSKRLLSHIHRFTVIGSERKKGACDIKVYDLAYVVPRLLFSGEYGAHVLNLT